ncbi:MAG: T9SS type A sorting domain-containing protein [Chitinophagales bacterium]|nr:T9SS type A sorting domain-containing protein [Chitinophagales bacterium]
MRYILLFVAALVICQTNAQNYTAQDMTLQLDENGEATLIPEDVLINTKGTVWGLSTQDTFLEFQYDQESQNLSFINEISDVCVEFEGHSCYDRNPINKQEFINGFIIDCCDFFSPFSIAGGCDISQALSTIGENDCNFGWDPPVRFSFDRDGILYASNYSSSSGIYTFDIHSKITTPLSNFSVGSFSSGFTYDFENHRLLATEIWTGNNTAFVEIDIQTGAWNILFEIPIVNSCFANAIEYIGNDILLIGNYSNNCGGEIYSINMVTQQIVNLASNYPVLDFLFVEDEIPDATLSTSQFTCDDLGEQIVDITVLENGIPVNYQATVNIVSDFSVRNCKVYERLRTPDPNGSDQAVVEDYTGDIEVVSSCSSTFTITQNPAPGTLIPYGQTVTILLTVTDEFGNNAFCQTIGCSDSILAVEDQTLEDNFLVYPNPTSDLIIIENRNNIPLSKVEILDINGRILRVKEISSNDNSISLSLGSFSNGIYFIKINSVDGFFVKQIIKR